MKKYIHLLLFICLYNYYSIAQTTKCNDSIIMSIKGTWSNYPRLPMQKPVNKEEFDRATKNMEAYHQFLLEAYQQGIGSEPQVVMVNPRPAFYTAWVYSYSYRTAIFPYICVKDKPVKVPATHTTFNIVSNEYEKFWRSTQFFINGQEVFYRQPRVGKWNGYDAYSTEEYPIVMLTRKDMLPYKPVTRKQYLDYMIHRIDSTYTKTANEMKKMPVRSLEEQEKEKNAKLEKFKKDFGNDPKKLKANVDYYLSGYQTDQQRRDEQVKEYTNKKNHILKVYRDELEKSGAQNLLDAPAIVKDIVNTSFHENTDIFITEEKGGTVLLFINTVYLKKDLPKYVPQFMVVRLQGGGTVSERYFVKMMKEKFPFEKLQAMIDK